MTPEEKKLGADLLDVLAARFAREHGQQVDLSDYMTPEQADLFVSRNDRDLYLQAKSSGLSIDKICRNGKIARALAQALRDEAVQEYREREEIEAARVRLKQPVYDLVAEAATLMAGDLPFDHKQATSIADKVLDLLAKPR